MRQRVSGSCNRALDAIRSIRRRLGSADDIKAEQRSNFAPYGQPRGSSASKGQSWTVRGVCLSSKDARRVPCGVSEREALVQAGLGEKKVVIPNITCSAQEFQDVIISTFPKLDGCGGFELLRCIPNTKELEVISLAVSQSAKLLKSVVGGGRLFIRPIQKNLQLDLDKDLVSSVQVLLKVVHIHLSWQEVN